jgi:hypothetical protein
MIDREGALRDARASEERWWRGEPNGLVDGLPLTVKDLILVQGMPTRRGSRTTSPLPRKMVRRLRELREDNDVERNIQMRRCSAQCTRTRRLILCGPFGERADTDAFVITRCPQGRLVWSSRMASMMGPLKNFNACAEIGRSK